MATRGTAILITNENVIMGPEFNGDMHPISLGAEFMERLQNVENNVDFIKMNNSFNKKYHGYDKIMSLYQGKYTHDEIKNDEGILAMSVVYKKWYATSDWIFVKNVSDNSIEFEVSHNGVKSVLNVAPGEMFKVNFGELI